MFPGRSTVETLGADGKSDGGGASDGGGSADPQLFDGFVNRLGRLKTQPFLFAGKQGLVDDVQRAPGCRGNAGGKVLSAATVDVG